MRWWHLDDVMRLDGELFGPTAWTPANFWAELAAPGRHYLVAETPEGRIVGFAGLATGGAEAEVQTIAVSKQAQGQGLGRRLLAALIDGAHKSGASSLMLEVRADNDRAADLYRRAGFEQIAVRRGYYASIGVDALIMRRRVKSRPTRSSAE
ncbi:ribosomal protein S18-alanine N-acetyltransferase [Spelaeicoccus albus]|nr:ribosomal protein S18-alanine N-acetyltransferase [Spelaeicoccus albus]